VLKNSNVINIKTKDFLILAVLRKPQSD